MRYEMISADCHLDLVLAAARSLHVSTPRPRCATRMPYVTRRPQGPGVGDEEGREPRARQRHGLGRARVRAGQIHRADRMAATGLYEDGKKGIRRLSDPDLPREGPGP